eukprot:3281627-Alexandrium_andersonii.AAC.1
MHGVGCRRRWLTLRASGLVLASDHGPCYQEPDRSLCKALLLQVVFARATCIWTCSTPCGRAEHLGPRAMQSNTPAPAASLHPVLRDRERRSTSSWTAHCCRIDVVCAGTRSHMHADKGIDGDMFPIVLGRRRTAKTMRAGSGTRMRRVLGA